jgi:hypothetical protein
MCTLPGTGGGPPPPATNMHSVHRGLPTSHCQEVRWAGHGGQRGRMHATLSLLFTRCCAGRVMLKDCQACRMPTGGNHTPCTVLERHLQLKDASLQGHILPQHCTAQGLPVHTRLTHVGGSACVIPQKVLAPRHSLGPHAQTARPASMQVDPELHACTADCSRFE